MLLRRPAAVLASAVAVGALAACGSDPQDITRGESEAAYLNIAGLKYQVQLTRQLNPADIEDQRYLSGLTDQNMQLPQNEVWFAVFMRVENEGNSPQPAASDFTIEDTQDNEFKPIPVDNVLAYRPETIKGKGLLPRPEDIQAYAPSQGALLLYKIPYSSLDNRPLELTIKSPNAPQKVGIVDLDV